LVYKFFLLGRRLDFPHKVCKVVGQRLSATELFPQPPPDFRYQLRPVGCVFARQQHRFRAHGICPICLVLDIPPHRREHPSPTIVPAERRGTRGTFALKFLDGKGDREGVVAKAKKKKQPFSVKNFLSTVDGGRTVTAYRKNEKVFSQGDRADAVFYVQEGKVKVCVLAESGKEAIVALHGKGEFFGEGCLTGQPLRLATVMAMTECVIMRLDKSAVLNVLRNEPKFSEAFIAFLLARNARVEEDLVDQLFNSSEKRLARVLLLMANFGKEANPEPVITKISQETLAEMIGTTRSRVSSFMNKFRALGFVEYNGDMKVHNSLLNVILHDKPQLRRGAEK
jgi:CRP/FNR family cyclic AMP-dependent transcriptional regulator